MYHVRKSGTLGFPPVPGVRRVATPPPRMDAPMATGYEASQGSLVLGGLYVETRFPCGRSREVMDRSGTNVERCM